MAFFNNNVVNISEAVDPKEHKMNDVKEMEEEWKEKRIHGQYVRGKERKVLTGI